MFFDWAHTLYKALCGVTHMNLFDKDWLFRGTSESIFAWCESVMTCIAPAHSVPKLKQPNSWRWFVDSDGLFRKRWWAVNIGDVNK